MIDSKKQNKQYCYFFDFEEECFRGGDNVPATLLEALLHKKEAGEPLQDGEYVYVAECEDAEIPKLDMDPIIDDLQERAYDVFCDEEEAEKWLTDVLPEDMEELNQQVYGVFVQWAQKHGYYPNFFFFNNTTVSKYLYEKGTFKQVGIDS